MVYFIRSMYFDSNLINALIEYSLADVALNKFIHYIFTYTYIN